MISAFKSCLLLPFEAGRYHRFGDIFVAKRLLLLCCTSYRSGQPNRVGWVDSDVVLTGLSDCLWHCCLCLSLLVLTTQFFLYFYQIIQKWTGILFQLCTPNGKAFFYCELSYRFFVGFLWVGDHFICIMHTHEDIPVTGFMLLR